MASTKLEFWHTYTNTSLRTIATNSVLEEDSFWIVMNAAIIGPPPRWVSHRRLLEQTLTDLHKCSNLNHVKQIHAQLLKADLHLSLFVAPKLISAYALSRHLHYAVAVFHQIPDPNTHLFNTLIRAHSSSHNPSASFLAFDDMQKEGIPADNFTYPFLLKAAVSSGQHFALPLVKMVHTHIIKSELSAVDVFVPNSLVDSYCRCGVGTGIHYAWKVFDGMTYRDVVSWNSVIGGLVRCGELRKARRMFDEMLEKDAVSWNTILDGYTKAGEMDEAFDLFKRMPSRNVVSWSTVISGYCKKGDMEMARLLFDKMPVRNLVTWTIMISGYAAKGVAMEADELFDKMLRSGLEADDAAMISILAACAESGLFGLGLKIHDYIVGHKIKCTTLLSNALLDMYAKCGDLDKAWAIFSRMATRDRVSWNSMVQGLAVHGHGERALRLFTQMKRSGITPDGVTLIGVLCACTHAGLVDEGRQYFSTMERDYGIIPQLEHYGCVIDLLGRRGLLDEAFKLANSMSFEPSAIIWGSLLNSCRKHNNVMLAEEVVDRLIKLDPSDSGVYAIMSNIYANAGRWDGMAKVRQKMKGSGIQKPSGSSLIEVDNVVHEFTAGDRSHPQTKRILRMLDRLRKHLKQAGYVPKAEPISV